MSDPGLPWLLFIGGDGPDIAFVCRVPMLVRAYLRTSTDALRIRRTYASKIRFKHRMRFDHFQFIGNTLHNGVWYSDPRAPEEQLISFWHDGGESRSCFSLVIKTTICRTELWVKSFHRKRPSEMRRAIKRLIPII